MNFNQLFKSPKLSQDFIKKMVYDIQNQDSIQVLELKEIYANKISIIPSSEFLIKKENINTTKNILYHKIFFNYLINRPILSGDDEISANFKDGSNIIINSNNYKDQLFEKKVESLFKDLVFKNSRVELKVKKNPMNQSIFSLLSEDILENLIFISIFSNVNFREKHDIKLLSMGFSYKGHIAKISDNAALRSLAFSLSKNIENEELNKYLDTFILDHLINLYHETYFENINFNYGKWIK